MTIKIKREALDEALKVGLSYEDGHNFKGEWERPMWGGSGLLFMKTNVRDVDGFCHCLTEIKACADELPKTPLVKAILLDKRIPANEDDIKKEDLPAFYEWQAHLKFNEPSPIPYEE